MTKLVFVIVFVKEKNRGRRWEDHQLFGKYWKVVQVQETQTFQKETKQHFLTVHVKSYV